MRSALWRLHHVDRDVVRTSGAHLCLGASVRVDHADSNRLAQRLLSGDCSLDAAHPTDAAAFAALNADLLPDWHLDDWLVLHREQWRQVRLHALEKLAGQQAERGAYAAAVQTALAAVQGEPLRESANRCLIEVHLAEGNVVEAVRAYRRFRSLLLSELDIEPSTRLTELLLGATKRQPVSTAARRPRSRSVR
jgi:DNA-binding SARP family transcriptional activator